MVLCQQNITSEPLARPMNQIFQTSFAQHAQASCTITRIEIRGINQNEMVERLIRVRAQNLVTILVIVIVEKTFQ